MNRKSQLRVLICDDSAFLRVTLRRIIENDAALRVVDIARNGAEAVEKAQRLKPDVITMDIHMPLVDGLTALKDIVRLKIAPVIILAASNSEDAGAAIEAIEAGAFDFIAKPDSVDSLEDRAVTILQKIKQAAASNIYNKIDHFNPSVSANSKPVETRINLVQPPFVTAGGHGFKAVALGLSTGGPKSIFSVLPQLPADLNAAVFVVQHMPPPFLTTFAQRLDKKTKLACVESQAGMTVEPGTIYVARGGYHLKLLRKASGRLVIRQSKEPQHLFMPSVDVAMESVCSQFGADTVGVLMTGMGRDGVEGMLKILNSGGTTIAESEETAIVFGMPKEALKRGAVKHVLPNHKIAAQIINATNSKDNVNITVKEQEG